MIIAKRDYRSSWRTAQAEPEIDGSRYELVAVYLWSVVGVMMVTFLTWLALGGRF